MRVIIQNMIISDRQECWGLIPPRTAASSGTPPAPCAPSSPPPSSTAPGFSRSIISIKMVIWGQVRRINEGNLVIFWLLGNLSLKFAIFLLQQTDRGLTKKIIRKHSKMASYHHQPDCSLCIVKDENLVTCCLKAKLLRISTFTSHLLSDLIRSVGG